MFATKRLGKELIKANERLPPGITLVSAPDYKEWTLDVQVLDNNPIYDGHIFRLRFRFNEKYPIAPETSDSLLHATTEPPEVTFITNGSPPRPIPVHPHIYSNGIICLDLLGSKGWSPVQNVESVCVSLQSMLTSNNKNERPEGDEEFCKHARLRNGRIRDMSFVYDDDTV